MGHNSVLANSCADYCPVAAASLLAYSSDSDPHKTKNCEETPDPDPPANPASCKSYTVGGTNPNPTSPNTTKPPSSTT